MGAAPLLILSIALGGCLKGPPVEFGLTADTGGHITYALGAAQALALRDDVTGVEIITRLIDDPALGAAYAVPYEPIDAKLAVRRIATANRAYLSKEANAADRGAFAEALIAHLASVPRLPDVIHAHFADAAEVARKVRDRFGIPFVYTAHSLGIDKLHSGIDDPGMTCRLAEEADAIGAADLIVASSRDEAERQLMLYPTACPTRIHCLPPGAGIAETSPTDLDGTRRLIAPFLRDPEKPMILAIARAVAKKNLAGLVDLYGADTDLRARANLVIVAGLRDGPDSGEPEQRAVISSLLARMDTHDLYGSMALPKRHSRADIAALYALARASGGVFVNPALVEPYGLTLTEAALHGVPVVATCHGGPADIVATLHHGRIADPRDPQAFANAIRALLDDEIEWARCSAEGAIRSKTLDWHGYAARFVEVVRSLRSVPAAVTAPTRLLLCDIDNTLTGCTAGAADVAPFLASQPTLAFGVATGRSLQEAERLLREWRQPTPRVLITSVGSEIYWRDGARLRPDTAYAEWIDEGWNPDAFDAAVGALAGVERQPAVEQRRYKRSYFVEARGAIAAVRDAVAHLPVRVIHSHGRLLDILPARAGKGAAMKWVAKALGIAAEHVYAAGDSGNDLDMLSQVRNGILVANHSAELKPLIGRPTIYVSRRPHAGGVVEGMRAFAGQAAA
ncbi:HAD-IIB family hydrolase [Sphingomonas sp. NBWT7]|uniref:HAD-IIB family hydrolase n=1 Tax=Sphingomonas sp. NBWT7 TaxID=2596913 RepID=UPI001624F37C|nr:HAD-IIB family hydrolase [Sphingomonas sp. NBWT7]QNE32353.1 HAD-IIB family hydrolase [Sphingomonas sp. NBWT7]